MFRVGLALLKISEKELIQETEEAQLLNLLKSIASNAYDVNHILHVKNFYTKTFSYNFFFENRLHFMN